VFCIQLQQYISDGSARHRLRLIYYAEMCRDPKTKWSEQKREISPTELTLKLIGFCWRRQVQANG